MMPVILARCVRSAVALALVFVCSPMPVLAADSVYVIVSAQSSVRSLTQKEVLALYTGRARTLTDGELVTPLDQPRDSMVRAEFYQLLTGWTLPASTATGRGCTSPAKYNHRLRWATTRL
jgi:hypothetical protein